MLLIWTPVDLWGLRAGPLGRGRLPPQYTDVQLVLLLMNAWRKDSGRWSGWGPPRGMATTER